MRFYNPLLGIVKGVPPGQTAQLSFDGGRTLVTVPGDTKMVVNFNAIHTLPQHWGPDPLEVRPSRWIVKDGGGKEEFLVPEKGTYYGWSDGMRACPGKKFGQVEHLAVMAACFRDHAVRPRVEKGESWGQTRERIMGVVRDSGYVLNIAMYNPQNARLVWERC
jgi:cytochrome P450